MDTDGLGIYATGAPLGVVTSGILYFRGGSGDLCTKGISSLKSSIIANMKIWAL